MEDVDLFTGGLAEVPTKGAVVGPTFACLLGRQMYYYKTGMESQLVAVEWVLGIRYPKPGYRVPEGPWRNGLKAS